MKEIIKSVLKKIASFFNFTLSIRLSGNYFRIPIMGGLGYANVKMEEKWMIVLINNILKMESSKFVDVGANIGQTLLKLRSIDEDINYIGFEPNPSCNHYLQRLIKRNAIKNVTILPVGISTKTEIGALHFYEDNVTDSSASILSNFRENKILHKAFIPLFNVETLLNTIDFDKISILKIDVEGSELEVLQSFKKQIHDSNPFILMEILPVYDELKNSIRFHRQNNIKAILDELNYSIFRIKKNKNKLLGLSKIENFGVHSNLNDCDYVFVPNIKSDKFTDSFKVYL